jgi:phage terminase large subunit
MIVEMNYGDNPWFPAVLEDERQEDLANLDYADYAWIWEGAYLENSDKQVLANKYVVQSFEDDLWQQSERLLYGADFGFAKDPSTLIRMFILDNNLYIEYEAYGNSVELDDMWKFYAGKTDATPKQLADWKVTDEAKFPASLKHVNGLSKPITPVLRLSAISKGRVSISLLLKNGRVALRMA